jgi:hypothetical protein
MYYDDHPIACLFGAVIDACALGGMYYWGNKNGQKKIINYYENAKRDDEINKLKEEIERLKRK